MARIAGAGGGGAVPRSRKPQPKEAAQRARVEAAKELLVGQPWLVPPPPPKPVPSVVKGAVTSKARPYTLAEQDAAAQRVLVAESATNQARARRQVIESMSPAERAARRRMPAYVPPSGTPGPKEPPGLFLLKREREAQRAQEAGLGPSFDPTRYPIHAVQAAGELAKAGGMFATKQLLGMAGSAAGAYQSVEGMRGDGPQWGSSGRAIDPQVENLAEIPLATSVWKAYPNILVAGGSALALPFTEGPVKATHAWVKNGFDILRGTTQLAGFMVALPEMKPGERRQAFSGLFDAMVQYYSAYGDMSIREAAQRGKDQPVNSVLDAFAAMDPVGGAVGDLTAEQLGLVSSLYKKGFSLRRSLDQVRELNLRGPEGGGTITVRKPLPQGGITRQAARLYDVGSRAIDRPAVRNKPIVKNLTETGRAARELGKQQNREKLRRMAAAHALFRDVASLTHGRFGKLNAAEAERLTTLMGAPEGMNADEFLISVAEDYKRMLGGREFVKPAEQVSAGEARALGRYKRLQAEADQARIRQRGRSITNIAAEQERLGGVLYELNAKRSAVRAEMRRISSDETLKPKERERELSPHQQRMKALDSQAKTIRAELDNVTVEEAPVQTPARDTIEQQLKDHPNISAEQAQDYLRVGDAAARATANRSGEAPGAYWENLLHQMTERVPEGALYQQRERVAYNTHHRSLVNKLEKAEADYAAVRKLDDKDETKIAAKDALDAAREDELYARIWYGSDAYKGIVNTSLERQTFAKGLWGRLRGRSGAIPKAVKGSKDLVAMMSLLDELTVKGESGRMWYENSARAIMELAGGDKKLAANIAQLVAIYSPRKAVLPNMGSAIEAFNAWKGGSEITNGFGWQRRAAQKVLDGEGGWEGRKTNNFYLNFLEDIDKRAYNRERKLTPEERKRLLKEQGRSELGEVTADMWMARVFGFLRTEVSEGRYDMIESVVQQLAKERGWKPKQVQAAIWTAIKDASDDVSANIDFADAIGRHHGIINYESAPGSTYAGVFNDVYKSFAPEVQRAFLEANSKLVDSFLTHSGVLSRPSEFGPGIYEGVASPGARVRLVSGGANYIVPEPDRAIFRYVAAAIGKANLQDAMPWARGFLPKSKGHADTVFLPLGRRATDEEALALYHRLNPSGGGEKVFVVHAGDEGLLLRRNPELSQEEYPNLAQAKKPNKNKPDMKLYSDSFQGQANAAIAEHFPGHEGELIVSDGELLENDWAKGSSDYDRALASAYGDGGDAPQGVRLRESADRLDREAQALRDEFTADPSGAADRHRAATAGRAASGAVKPTPAVRQVNQTRQGDILGATRFLAGPNGERIIYLTEQADITTLLHELVGHGVNEMKRYFPEEFSAVEEFRGRPLEEWTVDDHEWFAGMADRYFASGDAPTPELVNTFTRLKSWMRSIYGALKMRMGGQIPVEVRDMLDAYLGGYDEPTVSRITMHMGPESAFSEEEAAFGAAARARKDYEAIQQSNETRRAKASHEGKITRLEALMGKSDLTDAEVKEAEDLTSEIVQEEARRVVRANRREMNLNRKLENLTKALEDTSANAEQRDSALQSMIDIADDRENIMRMVFGDHYDEVFSERKDLIADYLVKQGLIQPDFATGTAHYFPMTVKNPSLGQRLKMKTPSIGLTSKVLGKMKQDQLNLHHRNNMILWQNGDWNADPAVLLEAHQRAQAYRWGHEIKNLLYELARPLNEGEIGGTTPLGDVIFINKDGTPIGPMFRKALDEAGSSGSAVHDVHNFLNGADGPDNEAALNSLRRYVESFAIDPEKGLPEGFTLENPNLRVLPRELVEQLTPPIRGSRTLGGRAVDTVATLSRWALIYANIPGYMIVNGTGNLGFLVAQQGPWLLNTLARNGHLLVTDRKLFDMITAETGELPLLIGQRGRGGIASIQTLQQKALSKISAVDRYPRAVAWMYEARKRGYKTGAQMRALIESNSAKAIADREAISNKARNHMVDFDRLTPFEREQVTRLIFVYPWIRGATAWPFWYAKEYPLRSAVTAAAAQSLEERRQKMLGPVPPWYEGLFPLGTEGTRARTINAAPFSPTSTALQSAELLADTIASILGRKPDNVTAQMVDAVAPFYRTMVQAGTGRDQFGRAVSLADTLKGTLGSMVPGWRLGAALINPDSAPRIYTEATRWRQFERTILRMGPSEISIPRLNAQAPVKTKPVSVQIEEEVAAAQKALTKLAPGTPFDQKMRRSTVIRVTYEAQKTELQRQASRSREWDPKKLPSGQYERVPDLTPLADAHLIYITVKRFLPGLSVSDLPEPQALLKQLGYTPGSFMGRQTLEKYRTIVYDAYAPTAASIVRKGQKLKEAEKAGVVK